MQQAFGMRNSNEIELELSVVVYAFHRFKFVPCSATDTTEMMPTPGLKRQRLPVSQVVCFAPAGGNVFYKDQPRCPVWVCDYVM